MKKKKLWSGLAILLTASLALSGTNCVLASEKITKDTVETCKEQTGGYVTTMSTGVRADEDKSSYQAFLDSLSEGPTGYGVESADQVSANAIITEPLSDIDVEHDLSAASVYNCMISMKAYFPEGMYWTNENFYAWNGGGRYYGGYGCAGFTFLLSDAAFGNLPSRYIDSFEWDSFRVGDILRVNNDSHSVIILEKYDDYVIVAEGNYNSSIHWGRKMTKEEVADGFTNYATRYPIDGSNPNVLPAINHWTGPGEAESNQTYPIDFDESTAKDSSALIFEVTDVRTGAKERFDSQNGRCKVLVFGGIGSCGNTMNNMARLSQIAEEDGLDQIEFWAFDIDDNSDATIRDISALFGINSNMKIINGTTDWGEWSNLYYYLRQEAGNNGLLNNGILYMPLIAFVDGEGIVWGETVSSQSKASLKETLSDCGFYEANQHYTNETAAIAAFVDRLYTKVLPRTYDTSGLNYWVDELYSGAETGAEVAGGFFFSPELKAKNLSDEEFVKLLYEVMMNRVPDQEGLDYWIGLMKNGYGRAGVFNDFVESAEFHGICDSYGIKAGTYSVTGASRNSGLSAFMSRLYTKALGRDFDREGLDYWCEEISQGNYTLMQVSTEQFFHSKEFLAKNLDDVEYVKVLYRTFFDREYDQDGLNYWIAQMTYFGMSRDTVLNEFANSKEFAIIRAQYGL